jgi:hypothetical protein
MLHAEKGAREPGKFYYVRDVATWSAARANPDSALFDGSERTVNDRRSETGCINDCSANNYKSPLLNVEPTWATFGRMSVLGTMSVLERSQSDSSINSEAY